MLKSLFSLLKYLLVSPRLLDICPFLAFQSMSRSLVVCRSVCWSVCLSLDLCENVILRVSNGNLNILTFQAGDSSDNSKTQIVVKLKNSNYDKTQQLSSSVTLRVPPLDSETGWTGELSSNCVLLILKN